MIKLNTNIELLNYVHENGLMGADTTCTLLKAISKKDNKIKDVVEDIMKSYEDFVKKSEVLLANSSEEMKKPNMMASISADVNIKFKMMDDNSDAAVADMLIKGLTMGEIEIEKKIESFDDSVTDEVKSLAKEFKKFQNNAIVKLKKYL